MIQALKRVIESVGENWTDYSDNDWNGVDVHLSDGGVLRMVREGGEGEPFEVFLFDAALMVQWSARFSASAPAAVVGAAVRVALALNGRTT